VFAKHRPVGILGLGVLGSASAQALTGLGFDVAGWSRTEKSLPGVHCLAGKEGFAEIMRRSEILVCLLPLTPDTETILNARSLALLPRGASVINVARGRHVVDADLLAALASGQVGQATLDVFRDEPLPAAHPFWDHPGIAITPHVAGVTLPAEAVAQIASKIARLERGLPVSGVVDRERGY
jgi:glyoxylate/hydroxypyruvate reductase A